MGFKFNQKIKQYERSTFTFDGESFANNFSCGRNSSSFDSISTKIRSYETNSIPIFIIGALSTGLAMATGEEAEEVIENSINVSMNQISLHEETAETFAIISYILGGVALVSTWLNYKQSSLAKPTSLLTLILALTVLYFAKQAGTTGGEIIHPEIRSHYVTPTTNNQKKEHDNK